jgi:hypothetical protein
MATDHITEIDSGLVRAVTSFSVGHVAISVGDVLQADDPIVAGRESLFIVPGPVSEPGPFLPVRPPSNASRTDWAAYVSSLGGDPGDLGRDELRVLADEIDPAGGG